MLDRTKFRRPGRGRLVRDGRLVAGLEDAAARVERMRCPVLHPTATTQRECPLCEGAGWVEDWQRQAEHLRNALDVVSAARELLQQLDEGPPFARDQVGDAAVGLRQTLATLDTRRS